LSVTARDEADRRVSHLFDDDAFALRTWSGRLLPRVHRPGAGPWSNLEPGEAADDQMVFGLPEPDALDGAALVIGSGRDVPASVSLSAVAIAPEIPGPVRLVDPSAVLAGAIEWTVDAGVVTYDAPPKACCTKAGQRADLGTMFVNLSVTGTVR